eukprot:CAMPEP_0117074352 /NCGR_PEP_ID=MMETSP0472-20121206/52377_1 /TAXON_ID=693140 ORGANISM="Tiarina fusus, Strain LIS" /NCGR_SAMPLE_ID=MMETSP0472 /ASSEMBLY_ACC=CAM_ASM_000603 /LENGTH=176 /DNA_ID=CAMNT_0004799325 /DNA_START=55 /DNA_END=585 /DNA_ORIENTATION=-
MSLWIPQSFLKVLVVALLVVRGTSFAPAKYTQNTLISSTTMSMVGGRGWDNNDYLGALSGDDDDIKKSSEDYQDYSERRKAFEERQKELMKSPQARAFLEKREASMPRYDADYDGFDDIVDEIEPTSGGGSRMAEMMAKAKRMQQGRGGMDSGIGGIFEQKMFNLDDDDDEDQQSN